MRELTPLCLLAKKYETDKGGRHLRYGGGDSDTCHEYTPVYHDLFAARTADVKRVLEIGINAGSSLRMWRDFFPHAHIYGLDSNAATFFQEDRITCLAANQGSVASLLEAMAKIDVPEFDLIVDDGSHELGHQIISVHTLVHFLAPDGLYVVEDMHADCHPEYVGNHVPLGFEWRAIKCEMGIGKAHCWCDDCKGTQPEQLLVVRRKR